MKRGDMGSFESGEATSEVRVVERNTRQAIIEAAHQLLVERGNAGVKVRSVAMRVGVTTGALYGYFNTREDLVSAAYAHALVTSIDGFTLQQPIDETATEWGAVQDVEVQSALSPRGREVRLAWLDATMRARHDQILARAIQKEQRQILQGLAARVRQDQALGFVNPTLDPLAVALVTFGSSLGVSAMWSLVQDIDGMEAKINDVWQSSRFIDAPKAEGEGALDATWSLENRVVIEQAKGVIAAREGISIREAHDLLHQEARGKNVDAIAVARAIVDGVAASSDESRPRTA